MICWFCHWGWPKPVLDIYNKYADAAGESAMHYGPAHIVWDDENFERHHIQWCLDNFDKHAREEHGPTQLDAVRKSLEELLTLPDDVLVPPASVRYENEYETATWENAPSPADFPPDCEMARN